MAVLIWTVCAQEPVQKQSPKGIIAPPGGDRLVTSQRMAVKAVVNMTFGEPADCQRTVCQSLVKALKSGTPAKRLACAQVLQHTLAHQSGRLLLHGMQIIPALIALCSTGVPCRVLGGPRSRPLWLTTTWATCMLGRS